MWSLGVGRAQDPVPPPLIGLIPSVSLILCPHPPLCLNTPQGSNTLRTDSRLYAISLPLPKHFDIMKVRSEPLSALEPHQKSGNQLISCHLLWGSLAGVVRDAGS